MCHFLYNVEDPDAGSVTILFRTVMRLLGNFDHYYLHLTQKTIFWLLSHITIDQAEHFYKALVQRQSSHFMKIHYYSLLMHLVRMDELNWLSMFYERFYDNGGDFTQPKVESVCATLLQHKYRSNSDSGMSDSEIFGLLLDLGLRPNIIFYNILLQNADRIGRFRDCLARFMT